MDNSNLNLQLKKTTILAIVIITALLGTIPIIALEINKLKSYSSQAATLTIKPYPTLNWTDPEPVTFNVLFNEKTEDEVINIVKGEKSQAESSSDISKEVAHYYENELRNQGFEKIKTVNDPNTDKYWVVGYKKSDNYFETQYYPTPYEQDSFTTLVFFGTIEDSD